MEGDDNIITQNGDGTETFGSSVHDAFAAFNKENADKAAAEAAGTTETQEPGEQVDPLAVETKPEVKATETKPEAAAPAVTEPEDEFSQFKLPKHARSDTAKQFDQVKESGRKFRDEAKQLRSQLEALQKQAAQRKGDLDPETAAELEDHRKFRRMTDFKSSPQFTKEYVKPIADATTRLDTLLSRSGYTAEEIKQAKDIGLTKLNWDKALDGVPTLEKNRILGALSNIAELEDRKEEALEKAKTDSEEFKAQMASMPSAREAEVKVIQDGALQLAESNKLFLPITDLKTLPEGLQTKEYADALNATTEESKLWMEAYARDPNPKAVAELLAIGVTAHRYLAANRFLHTEYGKSRETIKGLEAKVAELEAKYGKVKQAGGALRPDGTGGNAPARSAVGSVDSSIESAWAEFQASQPR
jgi:hypothetical protein